ncbi:kinase-like domain-containing protein [Mucidula mucida]|nr:kinase-like domain-containing protein [Mucidula mucida]
MRFWYFSRSQITISAQFDYHENPRLFIRFVIFMTFAPLEDLGYDPTVKRIGVNEKDIQYRFTVGDKVYQTTGIIHDLNLDLVTRATRVWEVIELDSEDMPIGTPKVLKDVWLYSDATPESDIYNAIFAALRQLDKDGSEDAKNYFMTILSDSVVTINGQPDEAPEPPEDYVELFYTETEEKVAMEATVEGTHRGEVDGCTPKLKRANRAVYPHKKRIHRRIVFEEVCRTLYKVFSYADFTKGLAQLVYGLEYMRLAGFVHRDISPGNCLIYKGQTKISDLEYARPYAAPGHGTAPLTGTPGFMAVEYQRQKHQFNPRRAFQPSRSRTTKRSKALWFKFNFLHDLESVLWIYLWFLLDTLPAQFTPADCEANRTVVLRLNETLFDGTLRCSSDRLEFMQAFQTENHQRSNWGAWRGLHATQSIERLSISG